MNTDLHFWIINEATSHVSELCEEARAPSGNLCRRMKNMQSPRRTGDLKQDPFELLAVTNFLKSTMHCIIKLFLLPLTVAK